MKNFLRPILGFLAFCYLSMTLFSIFLMISMRWGNSGALSASWELFADCLMHALLWPVYLPLYLSGTGFLG